MKEKKLSIIIPVYNTEKFLNRCVQSVVAQTYRDLEIILVDDGSVDDSPKICDEWAEKDHRIKVIHQKNGGASSARNVGIENATSEFIQFVDSDDYLQPNYSQNLMAEMQEDVDLVVAGIEVKDVKINRFLCPQKDETLEISSDQNKLLQLIAKDYFDYSYNKIYRRSLITEKFRVGQPLGEDRIFNLDYVRNIKNKIVMLKDCGYVYEYNPNSVTHQKRANLYQICLDVNKYLQKFFIDTFGTANHQEFYQLYLIDVYHCLVISDKSEIQSLAKQIENDGIFAELLKNYQPRNWKEKIKFFLLKHKKFGWLRKMLKMRYSK